MSTCGGPGDAVRDHVGDVLGGQAARGPRYVSAALSASPPKRTSENSVSTMPGATSVTRIAVGEQLEPQRLRERMDRVLGRRVPAATQVHLDPGDRAEDDDLRVDPARRAGSSAFVTRITPATFDSHISRHCSSSASSTGSRPSAPPALWTIRSTCGSAGPSSATESGSATSRRIARPPTSAASASQRSRRRAADTVSKPAAARARTVAAPIPLEAPVTRAIRLRCALTRRRLRGRARDPLDLERLAANLAAAERDRGSTSSSRTPSCSRRRAASPRSRTRHR